MALPCRNTLEFPSHTKPVIGNARRKARYEEFREQAFDLHPRFPVLIERHQCLTQLSRTVCHSIAEYTATEHKNRYFDGDAVSVDSNPSGNKHGTVPIAPNLSFASTTNIR